MGETRLRDFKDVRGWVRCSWLDSKRKSASDGGILELPRKLWVPVGTCGNPVGILVASMLGV